GGEQRRGRGQCLAGRAGGSQVGFQAARALFEVARQVVAQLFGDHVSGRTGRAGVVRRIPAALERLGGQEPEQQRRGDDSRCQYRVVELVVHGEPPALGGRCCI